MAHPNFQLLVDAAKLLKAILGELVFVGGCAIALLITDKGAADVCPTYDVDAIAEITWYAGYAGFSPATEIPRATTYLSKFHVTPRELTPIQLLCYGSFVFATLLLPKMFRRFPWGQFRGR
jgi:hypothetical protein